MSLIRCEPHQVTYDSDLFDCCPVCETCQDMERFGIARSRDETPRNRLPHGGLLGGQNVGDHRHDENRVSGTQG